MREHDSVGGEPNALTFVGAGGMTGGAGTLVQAAPLYGTSVRNSTHGARLQHWSFRNDDLRLRHVALIVVVALHVMLWQLARQIVGTSHRAQDGVDDALVWLRIVPPVETPRIAAPKPDRRADARERPASSASTREASQSRAPTIPSAPRQIDWRANAARSAQLAVEAAGQDRYRSFGPRKEPEREEPGPPSIFRNVPAHKYGEVGEVGGRAVVWMSESCYTQLDQPVQTARDFIIANPGTFASAGINCVGGEDGKLRFVLPNPTSFTPPSLNFSRAIGRKEADGTLFEHIKKPEEPPLPKAGTEMNELPERR